MGLPRSAAALAYCLALLTIEQVSCDVRELASNALNQI